MRKELKCTHTKKGGKEILGRIVNENKYERTVAVQNKEQ